MKKDKGRIGGAFVPMLIDTMKSPAWRSMSAYARVVYIALKSYYDFHAKNNGRLHLSARDGADKTGFDMKTVARAIRELSHFGFIVMTKQGSLGAEGRGTSPHWRLTELGCRGEPPTRDFLKWDGELFTSRQSAKSRR